MADRSTVPIPPPVARGSPRANDFPRAEGKDHA
jgi:hypothetical protein